LVTIYLVFLMGTLGVALKIQRVKATGTIYIKAEGSINPPTAPIWSLDNVTYTLTGVITSDADGIVVERGDIIIDGNGYSLQGLNGLRKGFRLQNVSNVTIKNIKIEGFAFGVYLDETSHNVLSGNNITANFVYGIYLRHSSNNSISGNDIENSYVGVGLYNSSNNTVSASNITNNKIGIWLGESFNNTVYHNNFVDNIQQVTIEDNANFWDDGYPSGGNYWSDYVGVDVKSGNNQDEPLSDGIGDTSHDIGGNNTDNYPLMGLFSDFNATSEYHVQTICNSTISDFQFNGTAVCFDVAGEDGTLGFCRICIPTALMNGTYRVFINGTEILPPPSPLPCSNSTHKFVYFKYTHSIQEVVITSFVQQPAWNLIVWACSAILASCSGFFGYLYLKTRSELQRIHRRIAGIKEKKSADICPNCGIQNKPEAKFCRKCGKAL